MSSRNSIHDFIMLLPALLLVGWLVLVIILMFRDDKCDKTYREGSFSEFICLHSERSSLRGFAPIFPDTCYHLTHYWPAAADIPVASDNPVH
ncbi:hypothetical protein ACRWDO_26555, partial [Escherichia coli]